MSETAELEAVNHTRDLCLEALRREPSALITDIDGTISEVAPTPEEAVVLPEACAALDRLRHSLALVAVVTGRAARTGSAMLDLPDLLVIGNHGLEQMRGDSIWEHPDAVAAAGEIAMAIDEIQEGMDRLALGTGIIYENKRLSATVHYRLAPDHGAAYSALLPLAIETGKRRGLKVTEGRFIIELRPSVVVNKGTAIMDLIREYHLRGLVFCGDDITDIDGFRAVGAARDAGTIAGVRIGVLAGETPIGVIEESDATVRGVDACAALLGQLADYMERANEHA
ncbi:MAG TPA: trehalose-phosphatase [Thermomicrobiales bacterium]|nr:trehalose-phosphatase [Thermomicrobiales bacterium]